MKKSFGKKILLIVVGVILLTFLATLFYFNNYYRNQAEEFNSSAVIKEYNNYYFVDGWGNDSALIFYPGTKVDETAYLELMGAIADKGVDCFLLKMPFHFPLFRINGPDEIIEKYDYDFYVGGHSLGGVCASIYAKNNADKLKGIVLLAGYSNKDLSKSNLAVLSIYGSNDTVMNREAYKKSLANMPDDFSEQIIEGGNHSYFGTYGLQKGDKEADITNQEQLNITAEIIVSFIKNH